MLRLSPTAVPFPISDRTSIHSRPKQADGKRFGDFEMDLIVDSHNHAILTIVERSTNMLFMAKLAHGKKAEHLPVTLRPFSALCLLGSRGRFVSPSQKKIVHLHAKLAFYVFQ